MSSTIPQTGTLYYARESQLAAVADRIKKKARIAQPNGKNICPGYDMWFDVEPNTTYAISADVTWDGTSNCCFRIDEDDGGIIATIHTFTHLNESHASGETGKHTDTFTTDADSLRLKITANGSCILDNIQVEEGSTSTDYVSYYKQLEFPDEFISGINLMDNTNDADATAADINIGKTAYVGGQKLTGTALVVETHDVDSVVPSTAQTIAAGSMLKLVTVPIDSNPKGIKNVTASGYSTSDFDVVYAISYGNGTAAINVYLYNKSGASKTIQARAVSVTTEYYKQR